ncbi:MAG TPA: hypothetical protein VMP01_24020 [Pirellulaceae bacterium]|nr:hypothetical protein [Pirellulaceae bacterium]
MMKSADEEEPAPPGRPRVRFALRHLLGLITIGCLLGGLCLWPHWWFEERVLLLTWGISLTLGEYAARRFGKGIWWPLLGTLIATGLAYFVLRSTDDHWDGNGRWTWSEYAWNVWRLWAVLLVAAVFASLVVLLVVRALSRAPAAARTFAIRLRSSGRLRWSAISVSAIAVVSFAAYWGLGATRWSPYGAARWRDSTSPQILFCSDGRQFVTVDDTGHVTLWDWDSARPMKRFRAEVPKSDEPPQFHAAMLSGNRLALASSLRDSVTVYRLPDWTLERKFSHEEIRGHPIRGLYSLDDGAQLLIVYRTSDGLIHFTFWDEVNQKFLQDVSHDGGSAVVFGVSASGRYCGIVKRVEFEEATLTIIDFETASVILNMEYGRGSGPVVFFDDDRRIGHVTQMFNLDGSREQELPGVVLDVIPGTNRLVLVEFQSLFPMWLDQLLEQVPIVSHIIYLDGVRLVVTGSDSVQPEWKSCWLYGYGTTVNGTLSPDGKRLVWADDQGRLLLWNLPTASPSSR